MNQIQTADVRSIALALLIPSHTEAQASRRKHFDKLALQQLADSIKSAGLLNPILVRPAGESFEIVAGERRFQAAKLAELIELAAAAPNLVGSRARARATRARRRIQGRRETQLRTREFRAHDDGRQRTAQRGVETNAQGARRHRDAAWRYQPTDQQARRPRQGKQP